MDKIKLDEQSSSVVFGTINQLIDSVNEIERKIHDFEKRDLKEYTAITLNPYTKVYKKEDVDRLLK